MTMERYRRPDAIRADLRRLYPATSWTVRCVARSGSYTRTEISWSGAPTAEEVMAVAYEHEGRRYVTLRHANPAGAPAESPSPALGAELATATPVPYDERTCASCGGALTTAGVHASSRTISCPCATCGVPRSETYLVGEVVRCGPCLAGHDPLPDPVLAGG